MVYEPNEQELEAIRLLQNEKTNWEEGQVWFTDREAFVMRNIIKKARKNFYGVFDEARDPVTGRKKIFVPLTEWVVETVLKNIDVDTKDIVVTPKKPEASLAAGIFNLILKNRLDNIRFGISLNKNNRNVTTDGTGILKAWKEDGKLMVRVIDRLNMIWDPSASIDESVGVMEINHLSLPELRQYNWKNIDYVKGSELIDRSSFFTHSKGTIQTEIPFVKVYERYGWAPKFILTGDEEDKDVYEYMLIVVSDLDGTPVVHETKKVKKHPYQDFKFKDLLNRGDGRGIPEMLFSIQAYVNETVNTRLNTARVAQTGLWRVSGNITPQQLKKMFATSAIKAEQGQIERINTGTVDASSYKDEEVAYQWAQRVTQTQSEDEVAASKPATNALIEERGASKAYAQVLEGIYLSLSKFLEEKVVPIIIDTLTENEIVKITGDPQDLQRIQRPFIVNLVRQRNKEAVETGGVPLYMSQEEEDAAVAQLEQELNQQGNIRFVEIFKKAFDTEFEINIDPAGESVNKGLMVQQLTSVMSTLTGAGVPVTELKGTLQEIYDTLGLPGERLVEKIGETQPMPQEIPTAATGLPTEAQMMPKEGQILNTPSV